MIITLILIIPSLFELCINTCLSILRAKNLLGFRTIALTISAVINTIITIILVKNWSYIGAAIGTAFSYISCSLIAMNLYYYNKLHMNMLKIYIKIVGRIWVCLAISGLILFVSARFLHGSWIALISNVLIFCVTYAISLWIIGLNKEEKEVFPFYRRLSK